MRKADRIIRDRHSRIPDKYKKIDTTVNGNAESLAKTASGITQWTARSRRSKRSIG